MAQPGPLVLWGVLGLEEEELKMVRRSQDTGQGAAVKRRRMSQVPCSKALSPGMAE